jgi:TorA maturation chaperone TorD
MTTQEKECFCQLLASLFCPPDQELVKQIQQRTLYSFFEKYIQSWGEEKGLLKGFFIEGDFENLLEDLKNEYSRLFSGLNQEGISLVESYYKPWTQDPHCFLSFAKEKGFLMGDSAIHLLAIFQQCGLEVAEEFKGRPDHIVMELEFLSYLYRWTSDREVKRFIEDHLDWIPLLKEEFKRFHPHPFYNCLLEVLDLFLSMERKRLEMESDGKKSIH